MRWKLLKVINSLQLAFASVNLLYIIVQQFRNTSNPTIYWVIIVWTCMNIIMIVQSLLLIHIFNRYFPDRSVPNSVITSRVFFSILSWITTAILIIALGDIYSDEGSWKNLDIRAWLIILFVTLLTLISLLCLILQSGLIRFIRNNSQTAITETINQFGTPE